MCSAVTVPFALFVAFVSVDSFPLKSEMDSNGSPVKFQSASYYSHDGSKRTFTQSNAVKYLKSYGYFPKSSEGDGRYDEDLAFVRALRRFQALYGLPITGRLDRQTRRTMQMPRCGMPDVFYNTDERSALAKAFGLRIVDNRRKREIGSDLGKMQGKTITYRISRYPNAALHRNMAVKDMRVYVDNAVQQAVAMWQEHIPLEFVNTPTGPVDIEVHFVRMDHGDEYSFDGPGGEVGHAFYPNNPVRRGRVHLDDDEPWGPTTTTTRGRNLDWVAVHEIGHTLGLAHSEPHIESIMVASYEGYKVIKPRLFPADIVNIQKLYGRRSEPDEDQSTEPTILETSTDESTTVETTTTADDISTIHSSSKTTHSTTTSEEPSSPQPVKHRDQITPTTKSIRKSVKSAPNLCLDPKVDAITVMPNGTVFAFKDDWYWKLDVEEHKIAAGYPQSVQKDWGVSTPLDEVFTDRNEWTWMIQGDQVWQVDASQGEEMKVFKPTSMRDQIPFNNLEYRRIDAVLQMPPIDQDPPSFFFLGPKYWFDGTYDGKNDEPFNRQTAEISPSLHHVDAAVSIADANSTDGFSSFLFSDHQYYKVVMSRQSLKVEPGYPRPIAADWFGCR